jgi:hypothetical protein
MPKTQRRRMMFGKMFNGFFANTVFNNTVTLHNRAARSNQSQLKRLF